MYRVIAEHRKIRRAQRGALFAITMFVLLAVMAPPVMGQTEDREVILNMGYSDENIKSTDVELDFFDATQLNTGIEAMSQDFLDNNLEPPMGVYYGAFLTEYLAQDYLEHKFITTYEEEPLVNLVKLQTRYSFPRNMIMSGASQFWMRLPFTVDSIFDHTQAETFAGLPQIVYMFMYQANNKADTFHARPIIINSQEELYASGIGGQAIIDGKIYIRMNYPIVPDKEYVFEVWFVPAETVQLYFTNEITELSNSPDQIDWYEWSSSLHSAPTIPTVEDEDMMQEFLESFASVGESSYKKFPDSFQLSWIFLFTQGMGDLGMVGYRQQFYKDDVVVMNPHIEYLDEATDRYARMNIFVPWVNHENREFEVDVRLEYNGDPTPPDAFDSYGRWCNADNDLSCTGAETESSYYDTRADMNGDNRVDYNSGGKDRGVFVYSGWQLIDTQSASEKYTLYRKSSSPYYDIDLQIGFGKEAEAYFIGTEVNGVRVKNVDTDNIYAYTRDYKKADLANDLKEDMEDKWYLYAVPGVPIYSGMKTTNEMVQLQTEPGKQASATMFVETIGGEIYEIPGDIPELNDAVDGVLYESPEKTGSQNTLRFTATATGTASNNIKEIWLENVQGEVLYNVGTKNESVGGSFYREEDSDGITVKDFLLLTTNVYTRAHTTEDEDIASGWRLYLIFREDIELTFLGTYRDIDRNYTTEYKSNAIKPNVAHPNEYHARTNLAPPIATNGIYSGIVHFLGKSTNVNGYPPSTFEPMGFELFSVIEYAENNNRIWGEITGTEPTDNVTLGFGSRAYDILYPFNPIAFVGLYTADIRLPDGEIIPQVEILNGGSFTSKRNWLQQLGDRLSDIFEIGGEIISKFQEGVTFLAELIIEIIPEQFLNLVNWLQREIPKFFTNLFSVVIDLVQTLGEIFEFMLILFIIGGAFFILLLWNRGLKYMTRNITGRGEQ